MKRKVEQSQRAIGSDVPYSTRASDRLYGQSPTQPRTAACLDPWSKANQSVVFRKDFPQFLVSSHHPPIELISVSRYARRFDSHTLSTAMPYPPRPQNTRILLPKDASTAFCVRAVLLTLLPTSTNVGAYWGHAFCHTPFILPSLRFQGFCCSVLIALISSQLRTRVASGSYLQRNLTFLDKFAHMLLKRHSKLGGVYRSPIV